MCFNVPTEQVLANIFTHYRGEVTETQLLQYIKFLQRMMPTYVWSNLCLSTLQGAVECYSTLYTSHFREDGELVISPNGGKPNLEYFNSMYNTSNREYLERITKSWVEQELMK